MRATVAVTSIRPSVRIHFEGGDEGFLRDVDAAELAHLLLALFLLVQQLALACNVAAIAFGRDVLAQRLDGFTCNHLAADRRLHGNLEEVPRNQILELLAHRTSPHFGACAM